MTVPKSLENVLKINPESRSTPSWTAKTEPAV
ncbi:hypothetical protein BH11ARM2_BH11ARM2_26930 [soil metagenome]